MSLAAPRPWRAPVPDTTMGQLLGLVLSGLLLTAGVILALAVALRPEETAVMRGPRADALQIGSLIEALRAVPAADRPAIARAIHTPNLAIRLGVGQADCNDAPALDPGSQTLVRSLAAVMRDASFVSVHHCRPEDEQQAIEVRAADIGAVFHMALGGRIRAGLLFHVWLPVIVYSLFVFFLVAVLSVWAVLRIIGPLQRLSQDVERFGREVEVAPLTEEGPREIRRAARAFNQMQERIAGAVRDRTRTLAAISHDLRTPITRMRLRAELSREGGEVRAKTLHDLDLMQQMISSALDFLRGAQSDEPAETVELGSLLQSLCDEAAEGGADVTYLGEIGAGSAGIVYRCRPNTLGRAVTNLVENACRYGTRARVRARVAGDEVLIEVEDDGSGIPERLKAEAMQPFARLDAARRMGDGVGLGLAIVGDIARLHGGRLYLLDGENGGLLARIVLPGSVGVPKTSLGTVTARAA